MADNRTMAQMLQASIEGYEDTTVVPPINANNFELKQTLINLVQSNQFTGRQDPHNHLRFFNKVTSTFRHPKVPNTTIKLLLFPFSLEREARIWLGKEPPRSILTWKDLDALDLAAGGNFLDKIPRECLSIIESKSKVRYSRSRVTDVRANVNAPLSSSSHSNSFDLQQIAAALEDKLDIRMNRFEKSLNEMKNSFITPTAPLKAVTEVYVTSGIWANAHGEVGRVLRHCSDELQVYGRFQVTPKTSHLQAVKRILRYLKGQPKLGLWYPRESAFDLEAYSDSDYAGANLDRKSTTGEAEYVAAASYCGQVLWIQNQMDAYEKKLIQVLKIHTDDNVAGLLSKAFNVSRFGENGYENPSDKLTFYKAFFSPQWKFLIHTIFQCLSAKTTLWNEFSSIMASAIICLAKNQKFNFSRIGTGFSGEVTPLFDNMLIQAPEDVDIDADVEINLKKAQAEAYNLDLNHQEKVLSMMDVNEEEPTDVEEVLEVVKAAKLMTEVVTTAGATKVSVLRKRKGVIIQDPKETTTTTTVQPKVQAKDKGKAILIKEPKPLKRRNMIVYLKNMTGFKMDYFKGMTYDEIRPLFEKHYNFNQTFLDEVNEGVKVSKTGVRQKKYVEVESSKREGENLEQEIAKKQKMEEETEEFKKHLQIVTDDDDVYTDATPLASKIPIVDYKIHTKRNIPYFKIIRVDGNHMLFISLSTMLKNFDREDLESHWIIVRDRFKKTKPKNYIDDYLLNTLKIMFEKPNVEVSVWRDQKDKYGLAKVKS
uniref:Putative ribonuclease H-like domain-containing protein n=1 Tax=Tanacetum cinerariifolium TaxID=118510 RepID=A0A6L2MAV1_TANCI|nr:putative ribonuclease H-like domain-containing protein [Tanacetum cinerariifolium]